MIFMAAAFAVRRVRKELRLFNGKKPFYTIYAKSQEGFCRKYFDIGSGE